jgi:hypothetical protein
MADRPRMTTVQLANKLLVDDIPTCCARARRGWTPRVERAREPGGVRHKALVIAYGVHETGRRVGRVPRPFSPVAE